MYTANENRYDKIFYNRVGKSGLKLPAVSLGLWHNFGGGTPHNLSQELILGSFDMGITHFDIANNYGPPPGTAEITFGRILKENLLPYRDELIISTKAGYRMWDGPYGEWGSKKSLVASVNQSLKRTGLDYFDIFYHHRPDPNTPIEETMEALKCIIDQGKALYIGISNYRDEPAKAALEAAKAIGLKILIHQVNYSLLNRDAGESIFDTLNEYGTGAIAYSPLAQGILTDKYFNGIPVESRAAGSSVFLKESSVTPEKVEKAKQLNLIAKERGQTLSQMALAWTMRGGCVASALIGATTLKQVRENADCVSKLEFSEDEIKRIDEITLL